MTFNWPFSLKWIDYSYLPFYQIGIAEEVSYKSRLQQFTQRASIPLPVYVTFCEVEHPPSFRSKVKVNGTCFTSDACSSKKMAEQEVAKLALVGLISKVKDEGSSFLRQVCWIEYYDLSFPYWLFHLLFRWVEHCFIWSQPSKYWSFLIELQILCF